MTMFMSDSATYLSATCALVYIKLAIGAGYAVEGRWL